MSGTNDVSAVDLARPSGPKNRARKTERKSKGFKQFVPRSVVGIVAVILAFSIGAALSGVVLFSYYDFRQKSTTKSIDKYVNGFDDRYNAATKTIDAEAANGQAAIKKSLEPLSKTRADGQTLTDLVTKYGPAVWFVNTLDESGQPSVGSAFAVASDSTRTLLIASYTTIRAATKSPAPDIKIRQNGGDDKKVDLQNWDESRDMALIILKEGNHPILKFAPKTPPTQRGTQIFAMSGLGANGGSATPGFVIDVNADGIQHSAPLGPQFQGGPIVDNDGQIIAMASLAYSPIGFTTNGVYFAPTIRLACGKVLSCPSDDTITTPK